MGFRQGVDERAVVHYEDFFKLFALEEIIIFLELFQDPEFVTEFNRIIPDKRIRVLAKRFKSITTHTHVNEALDLLITFPQGSINKMGGDSRYKALMKHINKVS